MNYQIELIQKNFVDNKVNSVAYACYRDDTFCGIIFLYAGGIIRINPKEFEYMYLLDYNPNLEHFRLVMEQKNVDMKS